MSTGLATPESRERFLLAQIAALEERLREPQETIDAIRTGAVDAFVISEPAGERIYTLGTAELLARLRLLADAGRMASESLDPGEILRAAARLAAGSGFADWSLIDLLSEGGSEVERAAAAHADRTREPLVEALLLEPPLWARFGSAREKLEQGRPALVADLDEAGTDLASIAGEQELILRRLAPRSLVAVPLVARGRTLGVWVFALSSPARRYGKEDVALAEELARRFALAVDNARLFREAEEANQAKDRFLATLSHELRMPLTPVMALVARLAQDERLPADARKSLALVGRNVELEARLIDDLLDLTRISRGKLQLELGVTDAARVVEQALQTCPELELAARRVELDLAAPEHRVMGDASRLAQVFWNLLNNALKFTPPGGSITVRSRVEEGALLAVEVADSGIGMELEDLRHVFEAFEQGEAGIAPRHGGLGLGLAISRAIVELHGGSLTGASAGRGRGATFTVRLPLAPARALAAAPVQAAAAPAADSRPLDLLLVEDHADTAEALAELLRGAGHRVTVAGCVAAAVSAVEAVAAAGAGRGFDVLISDLGLPDGSGLDLMRRLAGRSLCAIALSGYGMEDDLRKSAEAGFVRHLTKPVDLPTLLEVLRQVAGPSPV